MVRIRIRWLARLFILFTTVSLGIFYFSNQFSLHNISPSSPAPADAVTQVFTTSGTWVAPPGVTSITVEAWGAGGSGGGRTTTGSAGGGGGGAYARATITVTPGNSYSFTVGTGGLGSTGNGQDGGQTQWGDGSELLADGGKAGLSAGTGGSGGLASSSTGSVTYDGGTGANGAGTIGGGGGGGAGSTGAGTSAFGGTGGVATSEEGGAGGNYGVNTTGQAGFLLGGGGGGVYRSNSSRVGGAGAVGGIRINYSTGTTPQIRTGYYMGNGSSTSITGLGFSPDFVLVKADTTAGAAVFKTRAMPVNETAFVTATANNTASLISFDADGFTVGNNASMNSLNVRYTYIAIQGSDCTSSGIFCVGSYVGNASSPRTIATGFQPSFVMVKRSTPIAAHFKTASNPDNESLYLINLVRDTTGNFIRSLTSSGFTIGHSGTTGDNVLNGIYYYVAIKTSPGFFAEWTYAGNGTDNRDITGVGFQPDAVFVKNATNTTATNTNAVMNTRYSYGDSSTFLSATANSANHIQLLQSDGFQVGNSLFVNGAADTYYWFAFGGATYPAGTGSFQMQVGSYTGNGTVRSISSVGFAPDLVLIKADNANHSVFRTRMMRGDATAYLAAATADFTGGITSLDADGFSLGTSTVVNGSGVIYQWQAFGGAMNPYTRTGSSDFAIGVYTGNGSASRTINELDWQPNFVAVKRSGASGTVFRTSAHPSNSSSYLLASADSGNTITDFTSGGFIVGNTTNVVNTLANLYRWFAFRNGENFMVGSYTGNGSLQDYRDVGIKPSLSWIKRNTNLQGAQRTSTLTTDASQFFLNTANATGRITAFINQGFRLGTQNEVNQNGGTYRYVAWRVPGSSVISIGLTSDGTVSYGTIFSGESRNTVTLGDTQTVENTGTLAVDVNIKTQAPAGWDLAITPAPNTFTHDFSIDNGGSWSPMALDDTYELMSTNLDIGGTRPFDLRITAPNPSVSNTEKVIPVILQAVENFP